MKHERGLSSEEQLNTVWDQVLGPVRTKKDLIAREVGVAVGTASGGGLIYAASDKSTQIAGMIIAGLSAGVGIYEGVKFRRQKTKLSSRTS